MYFVGFGSGEIAKIPHCLCGQRITLHRAFEKRWATLIGPLILILRFWFGILQLHYQWQHMKSNKTQIWSYIRIHLSRWAWCEQGWRSRARPYGGGAAYPLHVWLQKVSLQPRYSSIEAQQARGAVQQAPSHLPGPQRFYWDPPEGVHQLAGQRLGANQVPRPRGHQASEVGGTVCGPYSLQTEQPGTGHTLHVLCGVPAPSKGFLSGGQWGAARHQI